MDICTVQYYLKKNLSQQQKLEAEPEWQKRDSDSATLFYPPPPSLPTSCLPPIHDLGSGAHVLSAGGHRPLPTGGRGAESQQQVSAVGVPGSRSYFLFPRNALGDVLVPVLKKIFH